MLIIFLIFILIAIGAIKTFGFSIWCFRSKNISGGISVLALVVMVLLSGLVLLK